MGRNIFILMLGVGIWLGSCDNKTPQKDNQLQIRKWKNPVLSKSGGLIADPSVIRQGDSLIMYYSDYSLATDSTTFNASKSIDGIHWHPVSSKPGYRVFSGDSTSWDRHIETPEAIDVDGKVYLYYIGYPDSEDFSNGIYESRIGLAIESPDGKFRRSQQEPVIPRGGKYDKDALTSPAVVLHDQVYYMIYTGWSDILSADGFLGMTGATSSDGKTWIKKEEPIFPEVMETTFETATEADIVKGPDGTFYLFFSAENGIGLARSEHPFGPWDIYPEPIITSQSDWESGEVVAPEALIENGKARIWYAGVVGSFGGSSIGYVEIKFPFDW